MKISSFLASSIHASDMYGTDEMYEAGRLDEIEHVYDSLVAGIHPDTGEEMTADKHHSILVALGANFDEWLQLNKCVDQTVGSVDK